MAGGLFVSIFLTSIITTSGCGLENNCLQKKCKYDNVIPTCILGCEDGYSGTYCQEICRNWCLACARSDPYTCTKCDEGWHGKTCKKQCDGCVDNHCHLNGTCVKKACPPGCKNESCDESGYCIHGCNAPFYGNTCNETCPPDCKGCDQSTGECLNVCSDNISGPNCTKPNCTMFCEDCLDERKPGSCSLLQGPCENRCEGVNSSSQCKDVCPEDCVLCEVCGICLKCVKGRYGTDCSKTCLGCKDLLCQHNGTCMDGCAEGYSGELCDVLHQNTTSSTDLWGSILELVESNELFLPLLVCALVLLAVTGFLIWMCRRRRKAERLQSREDSQCASICPDKNEPTEFRKCGDIYHEIDDKDLDPEPIDDTRVRLFSGRPPLPLPNTQKLCGLLGADQYMTAMHDVNATQGPNTITSHSREFRELAVVEESRFRGKGGKEAVLILPDSERGVCVETGFGVTVERDAGASALDAQGYLTPGQALARGCKQQSNININIF